MCTIVLILYQDGKSVALSTGFQKWQIKTAVINVCCWVQNYDKEFWYQVFENMLRYKDVCYGFHFNVNTFVWNTATWKLLFYLMLKLQTGGRTLN